MNVIASFAVLGLLILIHEAGHFLAAISQGIRVDGFSIGFGPALFKKELKGVTYALRAFPLGGFVSFPDEDKSKDILKDDPNLLKNRPIGQRALVISAGVIANLLLAWLVLIGQASVLGLPSAPEPGVLVLSVQTSEAAANAGLKPGDQITSIGGVELGKGKQAVEAFVEKVQAAPGKGIEIEINKKDAKEILRITPSNKEGKGKIGAQLQQNISGKVHPAKNFGEIIKHSDSQFIDLLSRTIEGYKGLVTNFKVTSKQLSGPVKIIEIGAQLSEQGSSGLVLFAALVSINLAVLNSLPLPLLDGGQLMLLILEALRGKPIPEKIQLAFMQSGFILLVGLSIVLIIRDTTQLNMFQQLINR